jgi:hypothetical protein
VLFGSNPTSNGVPAGLGGGDAASLTARLPVRCSPWQLSMSKGRGAEKFKERVLAVELVEGHRSIMGYHFNRTSNFVKVYVAMPTLVPTARYVLWWYQGASSPGGGVRRGGGMA